VSNKRAATAGLSAGIAGSSAVGTRVGGYRLEKQLGRGGMATVYLARDERLDRLVALKIMAPELAADDAFRKRFILESHAAAAVDDPHIIPVFEAGEEDGLLFIAMRYVPGGDVGTIVRSDGPMPPGRAAAVIGQVASALDAAHAAGLVHRDVKPANMLVDVRPGRPDHVYLADFGLSKKTLAASVRLTATGQLLGTLDYVAPEQIQGKPADGRTDQYALACAAFELVTGAPPFHCEEVTAVMYAHLSEPPTPVTSRRADLPSALDQVFARALAKVPADRYPSCQDFANALLQELGTVSDGFSPQMAGEATPDHPPTQIAAVGDPRPISAAGEAVGTASPLHVVANMPTTDADVPAPVARDTGASALATPPAQRQAQGRAPKRPWTRDWTAWVLILALPALIVGTVGLNRVVGSVGYGIGGTVCTLALLGIPAALIAKLFRWMRRRFGRSRHADLRLRIIRLRVRVSQFGSQTFRALPNLYAMLADGGRRWRHADYLFGLAGAVMLVMAGGPLRG
jgi:serine/threonine-protein kinase